ncbi:MAG: Lrp/AsnC family transcriptional regulator [Candidatus Bathyarchaeota archaeon]|nr:MAG: Lrp/AsnC family transcriptional regulator [Candidatus Bathyarchaeota archaeon]
MSKIKVKSLTEEAFLTGRPLRILRLLHEEGNRASVFTLEVRQRELAAQLGISRQALNVHLRKLRDNHYIRTGRGFIDITEKGLHALGISISPAFVFLKISPLKRKQAYEQIFTFPIQRVFRVTGEMDAILVIDRDKLEDALSMLGNVEGVLDTRTYIAIQTLK